MKDKNNRVKNIWVIKWKVQDLHVDHRKPGERLEKRLFKSIIKLECGPMPNVMAALPSVGGTLCSMPQTLADDHCLSAVQ